MMPFSNDWKDQKIASSGYMSPLDQVAHGMAGGVVNVTADHRVISKAYEVAAQPAPLTRIAKLIHGLTYRELAQLSVMFNCSLSVIARPTEARMLQLADDLAALEETP